MPEGLKDAEKCIELDPTFSKGYSRKAAVQFFMKEYDNAMETYQEGLKHDPNNQELLDGVRRYIHTHVQRDLLLISFIYCHEFLPDVVQIYSADVFNKSTRLIVGTLLLRN